MRTISVRRTALAGAASLAAAVGLATAAQAATPSAQRDAASGGVTYSGCPSGRLCLYKKTGFNGSRGPAKPDAIYYNCGVVNLSGWTQHHGSYIDNQTGNPTTVFFKGYGGAGTALRAFTPYHGTNANGYDADYDFYPVNSIRVC